MAKLLASKRQRWVFLTTKPADPDAVTATEAEAGVRAECFLTTNSTLTPTGSTTVSEAAICDGFVAPVPNDRQGEGSLEIFRDLDPETGLPIASGDEVFAAVATFGTRLWILKSTGPLYTEAFTDGHPYSLYEVVTDEPADPATLEGHIKNQVPLFIHNMWTNKVIAAGA